MYIHLFHYLPAKRTPLKEQVFQKLVFTCLMMLLVLFTNAQSYLGTISRQVNFREGPGKDYKLLGSLPPQTQVFIISAETENDFYNIIDITSNKTGYVHRDFVVKGEVVPASQGGLFTPSGSSGHENPEVEIYNNTEKQMTLMLNGATHVFKPQQKQRLILEDIAYHYIASAPNVIPNHGVEKLQSNTKYTWQFYIVTVPR